MVSAKARRDYINALRGNTSRKQYPSLGDLQRRQAAQRQQLVAARNTSGTNTGNTSGSNAADTSFAQWMRSATSDTNPIGKILGPVLESNLTQNVLKVLGTPNAAITPILDQAVRAGGGLSDFLDPERAKRRKKADLSKLPGEIGDNLYDLWNNDSTRGPVRMGVDVVDTALALSDDDVDNLSTGESWGRAGAGLALDIFTDPLSYVTGAGALKAGRVGSQTVKTARETGTPLRQAFNLKDSDSILWDRIRSTESWRRSRNPSAKRTAGRPLEETPDPLELEPTGTALPSPQDSINTRRSGMAPNVNQDAPVGTASRSGSPAGFASPRSTDLEALTPDRIAEFIRAASAAGRANRPQPVDIGDIGGAPQLESPLSVALRNTDPSNLPSRMIPFKWEALDGDLAASTPGRAPSATGEVRTAQDGTTGVLRPLNRAESSAWRRWMDREVAAGRLTKESREQLMQARREKRPYEDMVALYDRISRGTNETLTSEAPSIAESMPTMQKAVKEAVDSTEVPVERRYSNIIDRVDEAIASDLGTTVYNGVVNDHLQNKLSALIKRQHKIDPDRPYQSNSGAVRSDPVKGKGSGEYIEGWNTGDGSQLFDNIRYDLLKRGLVDHVEARHTIPKLTGSDGRSIRRIRTIRTAATKELGKVVGGADDALKAVGIQPSLGYGKSGWPLGFGEAYRILSEVDPETLARMTLDGVTGTGKGYKNTIGVPQSNIGDAIEKLMAGMHQAAKNGTELSLDEALQLVTDELFKTARTTGRGEVRFGPNSNPLAHIAPGSSVNQGVLRALKGLPGYSGLSPAQAVAKLKRSYAELIVKSRGQLYSQMVENSQRYGMERVMQTEKLGYEAIREVVQTVETGPIRDVLDMINKPARIVDDLADELGVQPQVREVIEAEIMDDVPNIVRPREFEALSETDNISKALTKMDRAARKAKTSSWGRNQSREQRHFRNEAASAAARKHQKVADDVAPYSVAMSSEEFEAAAELGIQAGFIAKLWGGIDRMNQWLNNNLSFYGGTGRMGNIMEAETDFVRRFHESTRHELNVLAKKHGQVIDDVTGETVFDSAFMAIKNGDEVFDPMVRAAIPEVQRLVNLVVETRPGKSGNASAISIGNMSLREAGYAGNRLARNFEAYNLVKGIFGDSKTAMSIDERAAFWRSPEFELGARLETYRKDKPQVQGLGTVDFLDELLNAHMTTMKESAIALEGMRAMKFSGAWSDSPKAGYVALHSINHIDRGRIMSYLPDTGFIRKEEWGQLLQVEKFLDELAQPAKPGGIREKLNKGVFPFVDMWKSWKTINRPGHHVRNEVGDLSMAFMAGYLPTPGTLKEAFEVLKYGGNWQWTKSAQWTPEDALNALARKRFGWEDALDPSKTVGGERKIASLKLKGGREIDLNAREFYAALQTENVLPMVQVREFLGDIQHSGTGVDPTQVNKYREKLTLPAFRDRGGLIRPYAVAIAEGRDHHMRIAHLLQFMKKEAKHFDNLDDLLKEAAAHVEKWHPTSKGSTPFERKNMNYIFAFYSWMRKAIPLTMEGIFLKPGRFLAVPKASYAIAQANGIEPHSLADPFPDDQLFPSFLTDKPLGPQFGSAGEYLGFNPGIYTLDVLGTFGGTSLKDSLSQDGWWEAVRDTTPLGGVLGSLSPLIKTPIESMTGERIDANVAITDRSGYWDQVIPGFDIANSVGGVSGTQTIMEPFNQVGSAITGQPYTSDRTSYGPLQTTRAVSKGNARDINLRLLNFILNMQGQDMSQPNYINVAEIEERNRLGSFRG